MWEGEVSFLSFVWERDCAKSHRKGGGELGKAMRRSCGKDTFKRKSLGRGLLLSKSLRWGQGGGASPPQGIGRSSGSKRAMGGKGKGRGYTCWWPQTCGAWETWKTEGKLSKEGERSDVVSTWWDNCAFANGLGWNEDTGGISANLGHLEPKSSGPHLELPHQQGFAARRLQDFVTPDMKQEIPWGCRVSWIVPGLSNAF